MNDRPILFFITGAQRSGTTWVAEMLHAHPDVKAAGEAWILGGPAGAESWLNNESMQAWLDGPWARGTWKRNLDAAGLRRLALRAIVESLLRRGGEAFRAIGDKTPLAYLRHAELLHELFPDARIIVVVRDGRDVAVSHMLRALAEQRFGFFPSPDDGRRAAEFHLHARGDPRPLFPEPALRHYAALWRECIRGGRRAAQLWGSACLELRYESLLEDPTRVRGALELLGVRADGPTVAACVAAADFARATGRRPGQADPADHRRKGVAGDWANHFTDRDLAIYREIAGAELAALGYDTGLPTPDSTPSARAG